MRLTVVAVFALSLLQQNAHAQTQITTVQSLTLERTLIISNIESTLPVPIPAPVMTEVTAGTLLIRERFVYAPDSGTVKYVQFSVPVGTPLPTPVNVDITSATYFTALLAVKSISVGSSTTYPSVQFSGTVASTDGPNGSLTGTTGALSFGYPTAAPKDGSQQVFNDVLSSIGGVSSSYSATAMGQMTLVQVPVAPGSCSSNPVVVLTAPTIATITNFINLDASKSFDCSGLPVTFQWKALGPLGSASLYNPSSPQAGAWLNVGPGEYTFTVTVTNANGISATATILVTYAQAKP